MKYLNSKKNLNKILRCFILFKSLEPAQPKLLYGGIDQHDDEILCSEFYNNLLATGGSEGTIKIWSIDTKRLFLVLRDKKENPNEYFNFLKYLFN